jgi:Ca2+-transporting ATPase
VNLKETKTPERSITTWHNLKVPEVLKQLDANQHTGLSAKEAAIRLNRYGSNVLLETGRIPWYVIFGRQFVDTLIFILMIAAVIAGALGEWIDAIVILVIVVLNGILGFIQEWKAETAIQALKRMLEPKCNVVRDGTEQNIEAKHLVPGDIVVLKLGDHVPADLRLLETFNLKTDESSLTGESESVTKGVESLPLETELSEKFSIAWMGTSITNGRGLGAVVATGMETEFGRIARLTQSVGREITPLQRQLAVLGKQLGIISVGISVLIAVSGWMLGKPLFEMFLTGVALAVAVVPEGLPAVVTITLALGVRAMVQRKALLRRLQASETLGKVTVICTDKTGTLTQNQMTVQKIWLPSGEIEVTGIGYDPAGHFRKEGEKIDPQQHEDLLALLQTGLNCNNASLIKSDRGWNEIGEPTEAALVVAAYKAWIEPVKELKGLVEFSFNSERKRMTVVETVDSSFFAHVKGAPEVILERCTRVLENGGERELTQQDRKAATDEMHRFAENGLRTLALARRELPLGFPLDENQIESELTLLGIVGIMDPPHLEVPSAIKSAGTAGIRVIMITGDNPNTAMSIAHKVGMSSQQAVTGQQLDEMDDDALRQTLEQDVLFARTTPEHKMRIVNILQQMGEVVGMTGDGVNDAPALKQADIGIAMGVRGTDVAKGASDMILTNDNFASIINAVEEGRREYDNIQKFVRYLMSSNMGEVVAIFINVLFGGPLILLPVQILWMNLITDGVTALALGMEPAEKGIMNQPPRQVKEPILNRRSIITILAIGGYIGLATLWLFQHYLDMGGDNAVPRAQTVAFTGIIMIQMITIFSFRSLHAPIATIGFFTNPWVLFAWVGNFALQLSAVYAPFMQNALHTVPLELKDWGLILIFAAPLFIVIEIYKIFVWKKKELLDGR